MGNSFDYEMRLLEAFLDHFGKTSAKNHKQDPHDRLDDVVGALRRTFRSSFVAVLFRNDDKHWDRYPIGELTERARLPSQPCRYLDEVTESGEPVSYEERQNNKLLDILDLDNAMAIPMRVLDRAGVLLLGNRTDESIPGRAIYSSYDSRLATVTALFLELLIAIDDSAIWHRDLFEAVPDGVFMADQNGTVLEHNSALAELLEGDNEDRLTGRSLNDLLFRDEDQYQDFLEQLDGNPNQRIARFRVSHTLSQQTCSILSISGHRVEGKSGWLVGSVRDVTEDQRWETVAKETLKSRGMQAVYVIVRRGQEGPFVFHTASQGAQRILGFRGSRKDTAVGMTLASCVDLDHWPMVEAHVEKKWNGRKVGPYQFRISRPEDGLPRWVEVESHLGMYEGRKALLGFMRDVTVERWRADAVDTLTQEHLRMPDFLSMEELREAYGALGTRVLDVPVQLMSLRPGEKPGATDLKIEAKLIEGTRTYLRMEKKPPHGWLQQSREAKEVLSLLQRQLRSSVRLFHDHRIVLDTLQRCAEVKEEKDIEVLVNDPLTMRALGSPDLVLYYPYDPGSKRFSTTARIYHEDNIHLSDSLRLGLVNEGGVAGYVLDAGHDSLFCAGRGEIRSFIQDELDEGQTRIIRGLIESLDWLISVAVLPLAARDRVFAVVFFLYKTEKQFTTTHRRRMKLITGQIALAQANIRERDLRISQEKDMARIVRHRIGNMLPLAQSRLSDVLKGMRTGRKPTKGDIEFAYNEVLGTMNLVNYLKRVEKEPVIKPIVHSNGPAVMASWREKMRERLKEGNAQLLMNDPQSDGPFLIYCDKDAIAEVLLELVTNALAMKPKNLEVTVRVTYLEDETTVEVLDNGPGIIDKGRAFQKYFTTREEGTGLGLSWSRRVVESHRAGDRTGLLYECGEKNHGAHFVLRLPLPDDALWGVADR